MAYLDPYAHIVKMAIGLISIVNPIGAIPTFITLSMNRPHVDARSAAMKATIACVLTLLVASVAGELLLTVFGITLPSFRIGGGILVLLIAISMMHARPTTAKTHPQETQEAMGKEDFSVVPMGIPVLSGPGAISTVILYVQQSPSLPDRLAMFVVIVFAGLIVYVSLRLAEPIRLRIGQTGVNIATRLMGLILTAMAVEFITRGLGEVFPALAGAAG